MQVTISEPETAVELRARLVTLVREAVAFEDEGYVLPPVRAARAALARWGPEPPKPFFVRLHLEHVQRALDAARDGGTRPHDRRPNWSDRYEGKRRFFIVRLLADGATCEPGRVLRGQLVAHDTDPSPWARIEPLRAFATPLLALRGLALGQPFRVMEVIPHSGVDEYEGSCTASGLQVLEEVDLRSVLGPSAATVTRVVGNLEPAEPERLRLASAWTSIHARGSWWARRKRAKALVSARRAAKQIAFKEALSEPFKWVCQVSSGDPEDPTQAALADAARASVVSHVLPRELLTLLAGPYLRAVGGW